MGRASFTTEQFIKAIPKTAGIITTIAKKVGCNWHTAKKFIYSHPTVLAAYCDECESILDLAESKLYEAIQAGDAQMVKYILSTKGKSRGYVERNELTGKDGKPIETDNSITIKGVDYRTVAAYLAPGSISDSDTSGKSEMPVDGPEMG